MEEYKGYDGRYSYTPDSQQPRDNSMPPYEMGAPVIDYNQAPNNHPIPVYEPPVSQIPNNRDRMPGYGPGTNYNRPMYQVPRPPYIRENPVPYYQLYGYPDAFLEEQENERDMQRLKEMYPEAAKDIMQYVEEECDKMEYEGSLMFDQHPDHIMLGQIRNGIYDKVKDHYQMPQGEDKDEVFALNKETRRRYPPGKNWLGDLIEVLLYQEMYRRRCRYRNCRRWY